MNGCIMVFGMPRSGTTWIGKLFDSHPDTLYRHEPDSVRQLHMPLFPERGAAQRYRPELERFLAALPGMRSPEVVGKLPLFAKHYQSTAGLAAYRASVFCAKAASVVRRHFPCVYRPTAAGYANGRLVWKSIGSLGRLGACIEALPDARAIHILRHPCGYVASVLRGEAMGQFDTEESHDDYLWPLKPLLTTRAGLRHGLTLEAATRMAPEEQLAWFWVLIHEKAMADGVACGRVLQVRYEDVCADPMAVTRRMFAYAGLDWQPQTEAFIRQSTHHPEQDYYSVFKDPMASAERWRTELDPAVVGRIMAILQRSRLCELYGQSGVAAQPRAEATS